VFNKPWQAKTGKNWLGSEIFNIPTLQVYTGLGRMDYMAKSKNKEKTECEVRCQHCNTALVVELEGVEIKQYDDYQVMKTKCSECKKDTLFRKGKGIKAFLIGVGSFLVGVVTLVGYFFVGVLIVMALFSLLDLSEKADDVYRKVSDLSDKVDDLSEKVDGISNEFEDAYTIKHGIATQSISGKLDDVSSKLTDISRECR